MVPEVAGRVEEFVSEVHTLAAGFSWLRLLAPYTIPAEPVGPCWVTPTPDGACEPHRQRLPA